MNRTETIAEAKRKRDLAKIHIAKSALGLDDDTYRALLMDVAGMDSASNMNAKQRAAVLERFESKGWISKSSKKNARGKSPTTAIWKAGLMSKISALLADQKLPWSYANGIAMQMYKLSRVDWCNEKQMRGIITALVKHRGY